MKYPGCDNGGCEQPWECNCAPGWGGKLCNVRAEDLGRGFVPQGAALNFTPPASMDLDGDHLRDVSQGSGGSLNAAAIAAQIRSQRELESKADHGTEPDVNLDSFFGGPDLDLSPRELFKRQSAIEADDEGIAQAQPTDYDADQTEDNNQFSSDVEADSAIDMDTTR